MSMTLHKFCTVLHMALAIDKMDGRGHFNTACSERLPKKTKVMQY